MRITLLLLFLSFINAQIALPTFQGVHTPQSTSSSSLYEFTSHTFTNCGATNREGPTLVNCKSSYDVSWEDDTDYFNVPSDAGIQYWTVPKTGTYLIEVWGAEGGAGFRGQGKGGKLKKEFSLEANQILRILVGQTGGSTTNNQGGGGGGGSFVWISGESTPLIIAGGGGGGSDHNSPSTVSDYINAQFGNPGHYLNVGYGGDHGNSSSWAGGGGGWLGNGETQNNYGRGGYGIPAGGFGAEIWRESYSSNYPQEGGFGGGGGVGYDAGGGGGGYTGGNGGAYSTSGYHASGGGSYPSDATWIGNDNDNYGKVIITLQ